MKKRRWYKPKPGEWIRPVKRGYLFACCDCGLVHRMDFDANKDGRVVFRAWRANRITAANRKKNGIRMLTAEEMPKKKKARKKKK